MKKLAIITTFLFSIITLFGQVTPGASRLDTRYFGGYYNIEQLGATVTNSDNTSIIQGALDKAHNNGGGIVLIPNGTFKTNSLITYNDVAIQGTGMTSSGLKMIGTGTLLTLANSGLSNGMNKGVLHSPIRDIKLIGDSIGSTGFYAKNIAMSGFNNVTISGFTQYGVYAKGVLIDGFDNCRFVYNNTGFFADSAWSTLQPMMVMTNAVVFHNCSFSASKKYAIDWNNGEQISFTNCVIELNGNGTDTTTGSIKYTCNVTGGYTNHVGLSIQNCWFEGNRGINILINNPALDMRHVIINSNSVNNINNVYDLKIIGTGHINEVKSIGGSLEKVVVHGPYASYINDGTYQNTSQLKLRAGGVQYNTSKAMYITTTQRDALVSPSAGTEIYNITTNTKEFYNGTVWKTITTN